MLKLISLFLILISYETRAEICPEGFMRQASPDLRRLYEALENARSDVGFSIATQGLPISQQFETLFSTFYNCDEGVLEDFGNSPKKPQRMWRRGSDGRKWSWQTEDLRALSFFAGHFFLERYFVDGLIRQVTDGQDELKQKLFTELTENQPWIEWDQISNRLIVHRQGAKEKLLSILGSDRPVYRGASRLEFDFLIALKNLAFGKPTAKERKSIAVISESIFQQWQIREERKPVFRRALDYLHSEKELTAPKRFALAKIMIMAVSDSGGYGVISTTFHKGKAAYWAFSMGRGSQKPSVVMEFKVDFTKLQKNANDGIYVGAESDYVEVGFQNSDARLEALKSLNPDPIEKSEAEDEFGPNLIKVWN